MLVRTLMVQCGANKRTKVGKNCSRNVRDGDRYQENYERMLVLIQLMTRTAVVELQGRSAKDGVIISVLIQILKDEIVPRNWR